MRPDTQYTRCGDVYLAYQVLGGGDRAILLATGAPTHIEGFWDVPELAGFVEQLSHLGRLAVFDKRGVGLSDRVTEPPTLEQAADDILHIMGAAGMDQAVLFGMAEGASACLVAAAMHPERVLAVVAFEPVPSFVPGGQWGISLETAQMLRRTIAESWGSGLTLALASGVTAHDPRAVAAWQRLERMTATPTSAALWLEYLFTVDVSPYLDRVQVPVLAVHTTGNRFIDTQAVRWMCDQLPHARLIEVDGDITEAVVAGGTVLDEAEDFIAGTRVSSLRRRQLVALLVTDLVGSTQTLTRVGDRAWQGILEDHRRVVREALRRYEGTEIDTAGDGFLATFRLASTALHCAAEIRDVSQAAAVPVRQGVHAGEVTTLEPGITGQAVHATARLAALAGAGEVLVSDTAYALAGSDSVPSEPAGTRALRGIANRMRVHRLTPGAPAL